MTDLYRLSLATEQQTEHLGQLIADNLSVPMVVYLKGDLGAGKTRLTRAILHRLGHSGNVKSPTYTLVEPYDLDIGQVYHFDLYRLADPTELDFMGIRDYFTDKTLAFVEWPEKGKGMLEPADVIITLDFDGSGRKAQLAGISTRGGKFLQKLKKNL